MSKPSTRDEHGKPDLRAFENHGFVYGLPIGALIGVLVAGPHFYDWTLLKSLGTIVGCGLGAGILGYIAISVAYGAAAGFSAGSIDDDDSDGDAAGGDGGGGGGGD